MVDTLQLRLNYLGGNAEGRILQSKLRSLEKALLYSYQGEDITLADGRQFRCLINPDKLKPDYDNKILSIPFISTPLNSDSTEKVEVGIKCGDIFHWDRTNTDWLVYLRNYEEESYFRGELRRCKYEIDAGNGNIIKAYVRGPVETTIQWFQKGGIEYNEPNYTLQVMRPATEQNLEFFHRFAKVKVKGKTWEVQAIDDFSVDGILEVTLKEFFENKFEEFADVVPEIVETDTSVPHIEGADFVEPYSTVVYKNMLCEGGEWAINNNRARIIAQDANSVTLEILTGRRGQFTLRYSIEGLDPIDKIITVESL